MGSPLDQRDMVRMKWDCRLSTGLPPSSRLRRLWSQKGDLQRACNRDRKAVWDQLGLSHCWYENLVTVRDEACLRWGHNNQSRRGHQCSETTLTGESQFHISTPQGFWTRVPYDGNQTGSPLDQWDMVRMKWDCRLSTLNWLCQTNPSVLLSNQVRYLKLCFSFRAFSQGVEFNSIHLFGKYTQCKSVWRFTLFRRFSNSGQYHYVYLTRRTVLVLENSESIPTNPGFFYSSTAGWVNNWTKSNLAQTLKLFHIEKIVQRILRIQGPLILKNNLA